MARMRIFELTPETPTPFVRPGLLSANRLMVKPDSVPSADQPPATAEDKNQVSPPSDGEHPAKA
jgi:hypothetical protein